jgi:hypothetical protein
MTLNVWRTSRGAILVECAKCGSKGSAHADVRVIEDPDRKRAMAEHHSRASVARMEHTAALNVVVRDLRDKRITRDVAETKFRDLGAAHFENMKNILETMPGPGDGVVETVEKCPWCEHEKSAVVQPLPDGLAEPQEWTSKPARITS